MKIKFLNQGAVDQWGPIDMKLLYPSFWFAPMSGTVKSPWGIYWENMVGIIENDKGAFYWRKEGLEKNGLKSIKKWLLPDKKRKSVVAEYYSTIKHIRKLSAYIQSLPINNSDYNKVRALALQWQREYYRFWSLTDIFEVANYASPLYLKKELANLVPSQELDSVMETLLAPEKLSFNQESQKELLQLKLKAKSAAALKSSLKNYAKKWFWLNNSYYESVDLGPEYFWEKIKNLNANKAKKELKDILNYGLHIKTKKQETAKKYRLPPPIIKLGQILSLSIWLQDHRKAYAWQASHTIHKLSRHLSYQLGVPMENLLDYSADEWNLAFKTGAKVSAKVLGERKKLFVFYSTTKFYTFYTGKKAKQIAKQFSNFHFSQIDNKSNVLAGTVVSKTVRPVKGKVRVLHSPREVINMKKGEILVTGMTSPDYIHAMRIAGAIITDTGGLMSHAAVVSRELKIPCIVGTKIATKVLKNGDLVKVDADLGKVTIIKRVNK